MSTEILRAEHIVKTFPGVKALTDANLELMAGEVHALLGENGAGKSTLINVLGGIHQKNGGEIYLDGQKVEINSVNDAKRLGISIIHQELVLVPYLSVAENIFLNREPVNRSGLVDFQSMYTQAGKLLTDFGLDINPYEQISALTIAQQQMVEIVKAVSFSPRVLILDEPTSSLSDREVEALFRCVRDLKKRGIGIIYISHRMAELDEIADRVTVMRDGATVGTRVVAETTKDELIAMMVGRSMDHYYVRTFNDCSETILKVEGLCSDKVKNVSFELHKSEILGFSGLVGAGRTELMQALFGIDRVTAGTVELEGRKVTIRQPLDAMKLGFALVPENRREQGIFPALSIRHNISLKVIDQFRGAFGLNTRKEDRLVAEYASELRVKAPNYETLMYQLSGGNQQKVVFASWLATKPKILILDEPTRGIDVGSKAEIYGFINDLAKQGTAIILVSSELPEIINMSDRVVVMRSGEISAVLGREELDQETIMHYSVN